MIVGKCVGIGPILPVDVRALFGWSDDEEAARSNATYRPPNWQHEEAFWTNAARDSSRVFFAIRRVNAEAQRLCLGGRADEAVLTGVVPRHCKDMVSRAQALVACWVFAAKKN